MKSLIIVLIISTFQSLLIANPIKKHENNISKKEQIPKFDKKAWGFDDFVFTKSGKEFYTYKNGVLHHWQFMPVIKHLGSIKIGFPYSLERPEDFYDMYLLHLSPSENKMLFYKKDFIEVWDLKKKKKLASKSITSVTGVMTEKGFVTGTTDLLVQIWSLEELKEVKSKELRNPCVGREMFSGAPLRCKPFAFYADKEHIYISSPKSVSSISIETLMEVQQKFMGEGKFWGMTYDKKFLLTGEMGHFKLEDLSLVPWEDKSFRDKYIYKYHTKSLVQFGALGVHKKRFIDRKKPRDRKFLTYHMRIVTFRNGGGSKILGSFYHNDKGNWYLRHLGDEDIMYFDSDIPYTKLKMTKEIYSKFKKELNTKDLSDGKY